MMDLEKKLTRGLKDLSPLFCVESEELPARRPPEVQVLAVSSPGHDNDSLFLNTFFASQIASQDKDCSLISLLPRSAPVLSGSLNHTPEPFGERLERFCLYWDEFRDLMNAPLPRHAGGILQSRDIFLDFEYRHLFQFEKTIAFLDKWVLLLEPDPESLTDGYKMMKAGLALNPQLEFYIALAGGGEGVQGEMIFERFSDLVFRHLDTHLAWLGWLDLADPSKHFSAALHAELLRYQSWNAKPALQKYVLAGWIESFSGVSQ